MKFLKKLLLIYLLMACTNQGKCSQKSNWRIMNGQKADWSKYKFMSFLWYSGLKDNGVYMEQIDQTCTGTLISVRWVLTACHCLPPVSGVMMLLTLGKADKIEIRGRGVKFYKSDFMIRHQDCDYEGKVVLNDIGMVKITGEADNIRPSTAKELGAWYEVPLTENITTVKLSEKHLEPGRHCRVAGWGYTSGIVVPSTDQPLKFDITNLQNEPTRQLQDLAVDVVYYLDYEKEMKLYWIWHPEHRKQFIWLKSYITNGSNYTGPIYGDSGGPLMCDGEQFGIACDVHNYWDKPFSTYVRVETYLPWIHHIMKKYHNSSGMGNATLVKVSNPFTRRARQNVKSCSIILKVNVFTLIFINIFIALVTS